MMKKKYKHSIDYLRKIGAFVDHTVSGHESGVGEYEKELIDMSLEEMQERALV